MRLSVRPLPYDGESTVGYLHRLAIRNGVSEVGQLAAVAANDPCYFSEGSWLNLIEGLTGHAPSKLDVLPLRKVGIGPAGKYFFNGAPLHRKHLVNGLNVCPHCLREQPFHRANWQLIWMPVCEVHQRPLVACGPNEQGEVFMRALKDGAIPPVRKSMNEFSTAQLLLVADIQRSLMKSMLSWEEDCGFRYQQACNYIDRLIDRLHSSYALSRRGAPIQRSREIPERVIGCLLEASL